MSVYVIDGELSVWLNEILMSDGLLSVFVIDKLIDWVSAMSLIMSYEWDYVTVCGCVLQGASLLLFGLLEVLNKGVYFHHCCSLCMCLD